MNKCEKGSILSWIDPFSFHTTNTTTANRLQDQVFNFIEITYCTEAVIMEDELLYMIC